jgi:hypothetical protein
MAMKKIVSSKSISDPTRNSFKVGKNINALVYALFVQSAS